MVRIALPRGFEKSIDSVHAARNYNAFGHSSPFSTSSKRAAYSDTIPNLKIGSHTRVLFQGFTGRQATTNAKECIEYGTKVVGGVKPGFEGEHLGLPVLPTVRAAVEQLKPDASAVYVPGSGTVTAIEDAIEAEIPLVVAVAEHIPIHDMLRIQQILRTQSKTRLVGANCPGIINTHGKCRIGFQPLPFFKPGKVAIVAKSGTLSYETVAATTRAGLGQTYCISVGGDVVAGTNFVEAFEIFEQDEKTEGIIMVGEIGGRTELDAAEWIKEYRKRTPNPKPIMALIGGIEAPPGRIMGHAGAWAAPGEPTAAEKIRVLEDVGVTVVNHPEDFELGMKAQLGISKAPKSAYGAGVQQRRAFHSLRQRPRRESQIKGQIQRRTLYIKQTQAFDMLKEKGITTADDATSDAMLENVSAHLNIHGNAQKALARLISELVNIFTSKEAINVETKFTLTNEGDVQVQAARFGFDDDAFKSSRRQGDVHSLRDIASEAAEEVAAEKEGMIYVKLDGEGTLGTIVNGAGLAMNTVDCLTQRGGHPANFLDTGGKATSQTIKAAFQCVSSDPRVKAILVNIFGGLTRCDMIAEGIMLAFKDLGLELPVVVRLRGTNETEGQKMISESGLKLVAADTFQEAAEKAISLAKGSA